MHNKEFTRRLVQGSLTNAGTQWTQKGTFIGNFHGVWRTRLDYAPGMRIDEMYLQLVHRLKLGSSTTGTLYWQWRASERGTDWIALHGSVSESNVTSYTERSRSGYFSPQLNLETVPIQIQLAMTAKRGAGSFQVKNSSFFTCQGDDLR